MSVIVGDVFTTGDILLPGGDVRLEAWSVIACDQFSSEPEYWERVRSVADGKPSTLNMIIPEAYLEDIDEDSEIEAISRCMAEYLESGVLREIKDSFVYVERTLPDGRLRRGLVGIADLEEYEFAGGDAAILASEGTTLDRLPPRIRVREKASLELPHIIAFIADKAGTVIEPLSQKANRLPLLYDFELMEGGGHLKGMRISGSDAHEVMAALRALHGEGLQTGASRRLMIMGDGNHSLAAAKTYWDDLKQGLSAAERESHPARRALLEVNNVYDPAISFEAIHRVIFDVDAGEFMDAFGIAMQAASEKQAAKDEGTGSEYALKLLSLDIPHSTLNVQDIIVSASCIGDMIAAVQEFIDEYLSRAGGRLDYIHGTAAVENLAAGKGCVGIILPAMEKSEFFDTVASRGVFPRKAFSVGHARDKRYYMECRKIGHF